MGWVIDRSNPQKMYVGGHPGFYRSEDGGESWSTDNSGLPGTDIHGLGMDPQNPNVLYAYIAKRGLYRSPDAGRRWELVNANEATMGPSLVDSREPNTLYLVGGKEGGFRQNTDGSKSWRQLGTIPGCTAASTSQDWQNRTPSTSPTAGYSRAPTTVRAGGQPAKGSSKASRRWQSRQATHGSSMPECSRAPRRACSAARTAARAGRLRTEGSGRRLSKRASGG